MASSSDLYIRPATTDDIPAMLSAYFSAFSSSPLNERCFPASSPETHTFWSNWIAKHLAAPESHLIVAMLPAAEPNSPPTLAGWARWVRRDAPSTMPHPPKFLASDYPSSGDGETAVRFFQANYDAGVSIVGEQAHWFLSMMVTRKEFQRRGLGTAMMQAGVSRADREGMMMYVNASEEGKRLYEQFGFYVADKTEFDDLGMTQYHMKRDARK